MRAGDASEAARLGRWSWRAFGSGVALLVLGVVLSLSNAVPLLVSTVVAIVGVTAMTFGLVTAVQVVLHREPDD